MAVVTPALIYPDQQGANRCLICTWGAPTAGPADGNALGNTPRPFVDLNGGTVIPDVWTSMEASDSGLPLYCPSLTERSIQVTGMNGSGGTVTIEGSNDGSTWATLHDAFGNLLVITDTGAAPPASVSNTGIYQVMEETSWIRPVCGAGGLSEAFNVILVGKKPF